jgi:RNA polymerase sigma-70 factor (ECF subfamily)
MSKTLASNNYRTEQDKAWKHFGQPLNAYPVRKYGHYINLPPAHFVSIRSLVHLGAGKLASRNELSEFLASVERRAYKQGLFAVRDEHVALDIVQDAMLKLAEKYGDKPVAELPMLFQRILQNTIRDFYRRQKVRSMWTTLMSSLIPQHDEGDYDPMDTLQDADNNSQSARPDASLEQSQLLVIIETALGKLPARQREAFLLRYWEDMDTAETAAAMGCSEGSVKTHCSRATHALAAALRAQGVTNYGQ